MLEAEVSHELNRQWSRRSSGLRSYWPGSPFRSSGTWPDWGGRLAPGKHRTAPAPSLRQLEISKPRGPDTPEAKPSISLCFSPSKAGRKRNDPRPRKAGPLQGVTYASIKDALSGLLVTAKEVGRSEGNRIQRPTGLCHLGRSSPKGAGLLTGLPQKR